MLFWVFCQLLNGATQAERARYHLPGRCQLHSAAPHLQADSKTGDNTTLHGYTSTNSPDSPHSVIRNPGVLPAIRVVAQLNTPSVTLAIQTVQGMWVQSPAAADAPSCCRQVALLVTYLTAHQQCVHSVLCRPSNLFRLQDNTKKTIFHNKDLLTWMLPHDIQNDSVEKLDNQHVSLAGLTETGGRSAHQWAPFAAVLRNEFFRI